MYGLGRNQLVLLACFFDRGKRVVILTDDGTTYAHSSAGSGPQTPVRDRQTVIGNKTATRKIRVDPHLSHPTCSSRYPRRIAVKIMRAGGSV